MPQIGFLSEETGEPVSFADYIALSRIPAQTSYTPEVLTLLEHQQDERAEAGLSATMLTGCGRKTHWLGTEDYYVLPSKMYAAAIRGTLIHLALEGGAQPERIYETRFGRALPNGKVITGKMDILDVGNELLIDYKTKERFPEVISEDFVRQLNIYRWILADGFCHTPGVNSPYVAGEVVQLKISRLGIVFLNMDRLEKMGVPLLPLGDVVDWIIHRARALNIAEHGGAIPPRIVADPSQRTLCREWCPFYDKCLKHGP